ncbi:hypothetical protein PMNALOAF_2232 [Methylobacterium adhaesivum]|nr:hypothetical protein PMNALOAF_2232 [Methylobacterium adhaesivum]
MAARPWLRLEWLVEQIRSCREHGVFLEQSNRTEPGQVLDFSRTVSAEILPHLARLRSESVPAGPNPFEEWVMRRLACRDGDTSWLDAMPVHAAISTCEGLGVSALHDAGVSMRGLTLKDWSDASLEGFRIASGGRESVHGFLTTLVGRARDRGRIGLKETYGYLILSLGRSVTDPAFKPIRDVVREHAFAHLPLEAGIKVLGEILDRKRVHTVFSAAVASNTTWPTMRKLMARRGLGPSSDLAEPKGRSRAAVDVDRISSLIADHAGSIGSTEVMGRIGITRKHLLELVARGLVPTLAGPDKAARAKNRFRPADIDAFIENLFTGAVDIEVPNARQVPLGAARASAAANIGDLFDAIVGGKLAWKGSLRGGRRFTDLLVDADEVMRVMRTEAPKAGLQKNEVGSVVPGLRTEVVAALIATGQLSVVEEFCPRNRRRIPVVTRESVDAFRDRYVTVAEVGKVMDVPARMALRILRQAGRKAAFDVDTAKAWIFARSEVLGTGWPGIA